MLRLRIGAISVLVSTISILALANSSAAHAQDVPSVTLRAASRTFDFQLDHQPLKSALTKFSKVTGLDVVAHGTVTQKLRAPAVSGRMSAAQALDLLLWGTKVEYRFTNATTVILTTPEAINARAQAIALDTITVVGKRNPNAVLGNLPPPYAGGQVASGGHVGLLGNLNVMDTPFNQTSYTAQTIEDQQARTIVDVVANDPSVRTSWPSSGYSAPLMIRGFQASNQDVAFAGLYGVAPAFTVDVGMAERVEILKGPSALLNGMQPNSSIGGSVNIVPKRATDAPITRFTPTYVSNGQFGGHVDIGRRFGANNEFGVRFNGSYQDGKTGVEYQSRAFGSAVLGLDYSGERLRLSADLGYQQQNFNAPSLISYLSPGVPVPKAPDASSNWFFPWSWSDTKDQFFATRAEFDLTPQWTLFAAAGGKITDWERLTYFPTITNAAGDLTATPGHLKYRYNTDTQELGARGQVDTGPVHHQLTVSVNRYYQKTAGASVSAGGPIKSNLYHPAVVPAPEISGLSPPKTSDSLLTSLAVGDVMSILDKRVQFIVGVRKQNIEAGNFGATITRYEESAITPAVGFVVKPFSNVSIYGNYIEGLQPGVIVGPTYANAGHVLPPYVSKQHEAGIKIDWGEITTTLSAFQITQPSASAPSPTSVLSADGEQRNRGLEFNVFGKVSEDIRLLGGFSVVEATLVNTANGINDGNEAPGVPKLQINLGSEWDTPFVPGFTLTGRVIYTGDQMVDSANTQSIPSWTRLDLGARYKFVVNGKPIIIRANVENVFNRSYWSSAAYASGWLAPGAPRTFLLSTTFTF